MTILLLRQWRSTIHASSMDYFAQPLTSQVFAYHRALKARKMLVKIIKAVLIEGREKESNDPNSKRGLVDLIKEGEQLDDEHIVIVLIVNLLAGRETMVRVATWATIYLYGHPEVMQKAKEEQDEIIKRRPYSQKGYLIPKGWKVLVWQSAVHMDPKIYSNPKQFLPSRWDDLKPKSGTFQPFGAGSSYCPGADFAKLNISIFLYYFLLNYKLEQLNPGGPVNYLPSPDPADNCPAKII
ncbi:hypothetical protein REPUB_Repub08aG0220400 [Reevesia pubescens]